MGKKGKEKSKKGKDETSSKKEDVAPSKIDFSLNYRDRKSPICVKVKHKNETFVLFSDEFNKAIEIKDQLAKMKNVPIENIKLYFINKRIIEDEYMNYDQQIKHATILFAVFKNSNGDWENINDIIKNN
jgi:hypothetical protein